MRVAVLASDDTTTRLIEESALSGVDCGAFAASLDGVAGVVVAVEYLSLRLVAECDARAIPFVALSSEAASQALGAFGLDASLPIAAPWAEILEALGFSSGPNPSDSDLPAMQSNSESHRADEPRRSGRVTAVWGPAGAPGRSVLALNLASEAVLMGHRVLLVDADTYGGSIAGYLELFDEAPGFLAASRLAGQGLLTSQEIARLAHVVRMGDGELTVLSGIVSPRRWPELTAARVRACEAELRNHFDVIVCDLGFNLEQDEEIASDVTAPRRNQATLELLRCADQVVAVSSCDVIGLARYIQSLEELKQSIDTDRVVWVANRAQAARGSHAAIVRQTLSRFAGLTSVDVLDDDPKALAASIEHAAPLCVVSPKSKVRTQVQALAQRCFA